MAAGQVATRKSRKHNENFGDFCIFPSETVYLSLKKRPFLTKRYADIYQKFHNVPETY